MEKEKGTQSKENVPAAPGAMSEAMPLAGQFYRHFKGGLYQIIGRARDAGDGREIIVYQALYGDYRWYVRAAEEFMSFVDGEKYPQFAGKRRFERVEPAAESDRVARGSMPEQTERDEDRSEEESKEQIRPELLRFLDARSAAEKLRVLREIRGKMDEELLTNLELSLDLMPDERESAERRLELVELNLEKRARFEGGRLR